MARILVIDDDLMLRQVVAEVLQMSHEVFTAANGLEGVQIAQSSFPDLVICDVAMPYMDGFDVLRTIHQIEALADVPFIYLSGTHDRKIIRQGMTLGADDFLTKPFTVDELLNAVESRLEKRARRQAMITRAIDELRLNITTALPHELRTAIMIVEGYAHLVLEDADRIDPVQREMMTGIYTNAVRLRHMAEKYVWYLRSYLPHPTDLNMIARQPARLIEETAWAVAQRFDRTDDLSLSLEEGQIAISEDYLTKITEELAENACKFSQPGTPVTVLGLAGGSSYMLRISNFGREMTPEQVQQIGGFMQFDRAQYEQQGTGLGLIIAKRLVELSSGALTVLSEAGATTFTITLPRQRDAQPWPSRLTT